MWPWKRQDAKDGLQTLSRRLDDVESTVRSLKTEWLDTLDRLERIAGRLAKRAQRDGQAAGVLSAPLHDLDQGRGDGGASPPVSPALVEVMKRRGLHRPPGAR